MSSRPAPPAPIRRRASLWHEVPGVSIRDFVNVQKALIDSLGIRKLKAVMGASMGALQAYEWAANYPDSVERIIPIIASAGGAAFLMGWLDIGGQPIRLDPKWKGGDYYDSDPPTDGLKAALKVVTCTPTTTTGLPKPLAWHRPKRERTRPKHSATSSRSRRRLPGARRPRTRIAFSISPKRTSSSRPIQPKSKCRRW